MKGLVVLLRRDLILEMHTIGERTAVSSHFPSIPLLIFPHCCAFLTANHPKLASYLLIPTIVHAPSLSIHIHCSSSLCSFSPLPISLIPPTTHFLHSPLPSSPHFPFLIFPSLPYLPPTSPSISIAHLFLCLSFPTAILLTTHLPLPTTDFSPLLPP